MVAHSYNPGDWRHSLSLQPVWSIYQALGQPRLHRDTPQLNKIMVALTAGCRGLDCPVWGAMVHFTVQRKAVGRDLGLWCPKMSTSRLCIPPSSQTRMLNIPNPKCLGSECSWFVYFLGLGKLHGILPVEHFWAPKLKCSLKSKLFFGAGPQVQEAWGTTKLHS